MYIHNRDSMAEKEKKTITVKIPSFSFSWKLVSIVLGVLLIVSLFFNFRGGFRSTGAVVETRGLTEEQLSKKVVDYVNNNLVRTGKVSFVSMEEMAGMYKVTISYQGRQIPVYTTKDGSYLFTTQPLDTSEELPKGEEPETPEVPKTDRPKVELFLMSFCPFGNRAENTMLPVYNLLKDKVDWKINYIVRVSGDKVNSLHGQPEVDQDKREACVLSEYGLDEWWNFTVYVNNNCGSSGDCWEEAANQAGLDTNKINDCVSKKGLELMKASESATNEAGATGSPTLIINGVKSRAVYQYGNPEAYKKAICEAFVSPPEECSEVLKSSGSGTSTGGQC